MSKKRAFVRYTKSGEIVPGSLIITTNGGYPDKSSLWQEVSVDQCCGSICKEECEVETPVIPFFQELYDGTYVNASYQPWSQFAYIQLDPLPGYIDPNDSIVSRPSLIYECTTLDDRPNRASISYPYIVATDIPPVYPLPMDTAGLYNVVLPLILNGLNNVNYPPGEEVVYSFTQVVIPTLDVRTDPGDESIIETLTNVPGVIIKLKGKVACKNCAEYFKFTFRHEYDQEGGGVPPAIPQITLNFRKP